MKALIILFILSPLYTLANNYDFYQNRYNLTDVNTKLINNHGEGFEPLYGVRNFRSILNGFLFRGGANNKWHRTNPRNNHNPLPNDGLQNLCKEGFSKAVYLYNTRYETSPSEMNCQSIHGESNKIEYVNLVAHRQNEILGILELVHSALMNNEGPIYLHCWNGWHASGAISAIAFKQFCGFKNPDLIAYWDRNTDGHNDEPQYERIRNRIRNFKPLKRLQISAELRDQLCPDTLE